jgi:solute carrier family 25 oxoglutarate transporter 11
MSEAERTPHIASKPKKGTWITLKPFVYGGLSGMFATCCVQPIDIVKVRIQLSGEGTSQAISKNPFRVGYNIVKNEGFRTLYTGLSAGLLRQATYTTTRLGLYQTLVGKLKKPGENLSLIKKVGASLTAGGIGSLIGTPCDVSLIRMQADNLLPIEQRRGYKHVFDAFLKILRQDGFFGMFAGGTPVVIRAMAINVGMLASYDQTIDIIKKYTKNDFAILTTAKLVSGFFSVAFSLPFDFLKTRLQKQKKVNGQLPYKGLMDCAIKVARNEGIGRFYAGFWTYYIRIAPHVMITWWALEKLKKWIDLKNPPWKKN